MTTLEVEPIIGQPRGVRPEIPQDNLSKLRSLMPDLQDRRIIDIALHQVTKDLLSEIFPDHNGQNQDKGGPSGLDISGVHLTVEQLRSMKPVVNLSNIVATVYGAMGMKEKSNPNQDRVLLGLLNLTTCWYIVSELGEIQILEQGIDGKTSQATQITLNGWPITLTEILAARVAARMLLRLSGECTDSEQAEKRMESMGLNLLSIQTTVQEQVKLFQQRKQAEAEQLPIITQYEAGGKVGFTIAQVGEHLGIDPDMDRTWRGRTIAMIKEIIKPKQTGIVTPLDLKNALSLVLLNASQAEQEEVIDVIHNLFGQTALEYDPRTGLASGDVIVNTVTAHREGLLSGTVQISYPISVSLFNEIVQRAVTRGGCSLPKGWLQLKEAGKSCVRWPNILVKDFCTSLLDRINIFNTPEAIRELTLTVETIKTLFSTNVRVSDETVADYIDEKLRQIIIERTKEIEGNAKIRVAFQTTVKSLGI